MVWTMDDQDSRVPLVGPTGKIPRLKSRWLACLAVLLVFPLQLLVSGLFLALMARRGGFASGQEWLEQGGLSSIGGIVALILPSQCLLIGAALFFRHHSRPTHRGLGLEQPRLAWPLIACLVLGTPTIYFCGGLLAHFSGLESGPSSELITRLATTEDLALSLCFGVLATLGAAISEELFFRGYLQRSLRADLGAWPALAISSLSFAIYHHEPLHILQVLLPGVWFAFLAERTQSTWPSLLAHCVGNGTSLLVARLSLLQGSREGLPTFDVALSAMGGLAVLFVSPPALLAGLYLMGRVPKSAAPTS